ncbi:MAG: hypothetical protein AB7S70_07315 [Hyphomicrobium sp.]
MRTAIAERLRAISDWGLVQMHKSAAADRLSPLHDLRLPGDVWAST